MQVAIVTGASGGIGFGCASKARRDGHGGAGDRTKRGTSSPSWPQAHRRSRSGGHRSPSISPTTTAPKRITDLAVDRWGHIDFLVNIAGIGSPKPVHETDDESLDHFLDLMLRAPFRLIREVLPHLGPGSAIINVTSTFAVVGGLRGGAYSAAKGGLTALTTHIACQYGAQGIRCNAVAPGVIQTPMTEHRLQDQRFRRINTEMTPHQRLGTVEDVASTVAFLCSARRCFHQRPDDRRRRRLELDEVSFGVGVEFGVGSRARRSPGFEVAADARQHLDVRLDRLARRHRGQQPGRGEPDSLGDPGAAIDRLETHRPAQAHPGGLVGLGQHIAVGRAPAAARW